MNNIFEMLKSLYKGENVAKKHLLLLLLLVLPTIAGTVIGLVDKETPTKLLIIILAVSAFFLILSIIPALGLSGMALSFMHNRYHNKEEGIPMFNKEMLITGIKALPLYIVWGVYWTVLGMLGVGLCFAPVFITIATSGTNISDDILPFIGLLILAMFLVFIFTFVLYLLIPFASYVSITYAKDFEYSGKLFNPLIIIEFMKKSFKNSILIALKYIVVNLIVSFASSFIYGIGVILILVIALFAAISIPENVELATVPWFIVVTTIISALMALVQVYASTIVGYGMAGNLVEVYKDEVEPME